MQANRFRTIKEFEVSRNLQIELEALQKTIYRYQGVDITDEQSLITLIRLLNELANTTRDYGEFTANVMPSYFLDNRETIIKMNGSLSDSCSLMYTKIQSTTLSAFNYLGNLLSKTINTLHFQNTTFNDIVTQNAIHPITRQIEISRDILDLSTRISDATILLDEQIQKRPRATTNPHKDSTVFTQVVVVLDKDFDRFTEQDLQILTTKIRSALQLPAKQMRLIGISRGSIQIILEMPEEQAKRLIAMFIDRDELIVGLGISRVELTKSTSVQSGGLNETKDTSSHIEERDSLPKIDNSKRAKLRVVMTETFNETEIHNLAFDLNINDGHLPGKTVLDKIREIILYSERHGMFESLYEKVNELRPGKL